MRRTICSARKLALSQLYPISLVFLGLVRVHDLTWSCYLIFDLFSSLDYTVPPNF